MKVGESLYRGLKRIVDVAVAGTCLLATGPLLLGIGVAVKADSRGPVLFRQGRLGKGGKVFELFKFRTMRQDAGVLLGEEGFVLNPAGDQRVTRVGAVLRRTSLDELPQLWNVLLGEMSLVGPRPDLPVAMGMYDETERRKLSVAPGLTGLAQVTGRNSLGGRERWKLDAEYAEKASARLDGWILWRTVGVVIGGRGIHFEGAAGRPAGPGKASEEGGREA